MKIKRFFAIIVALCLFLTGCSKSVDWDKDIQKLENAGYTVTYHTSEEELASITHELNSWAKFNGYDLTFEVEKYTDLLKDNDYDFQVIFFQFANEDQALNYYNFAIETRIEDGVNKFYVSEDIVVIADNKEAINILGYDFK